MRRRRTQSREAAKTRNGTKPKRSSTSRAAHRTSSSVADLQSQVSALTLELAEARERQEATADVGAKAPCRASQHFRGCYHRRIPAGTSRAGFLKGLG